MNQPQPQFPFRSEEKVDRQNLKSVKKGKRKIHWQVGHLEQAIKTHGIYEIEFKLAHEIQSQRESRFEFYVFMPPGLQIPLEHLDPAYALGNVKDNIRKQTPKFDFNPTPKAPGKELEKLYQLLDSWRSLSPAKATAQLRKRIKAYAAAYRKFIKAQAHYLRMILKSGVPSEEMNFKTDALLNRIHWNWKHYRRWWEEMESLLYSDENNAEFAQVDQYLSDHYCLFHLRSHQNLQKYGQIHSLEKVYEALEKEDLFRRQRGELSFIQEEETLDKAKLQQREHLFMHSLEKKFVDSALYLRTKIQKVSDDSQWFAMSAALLAMLFFTYALVFFQTTFGISDGAHSWIFVAVLLYVFKDRIKELVRIAMNRMRSRHRANRVSKIYDDNEHVGNMEERLTFPDAEKLAEEIKDIRYRGEMGRLERRLLTHEHVQHYQKRMTFKWDEKDPEPIVEIMRFDLQPWLAKADSAHAPYITIDPDNRKINTTRSERVYRLHVLMRMVTYEKKHWWSRKKQEHESNWQHVYVTMTRDGIIGLNET